MDVVLLRWPAEAARREDLVEIGQARLLLVEDGAMPPEALDCIEDWIRVPASELDLRARLTALEVRARHHSVTTPTLDGDGVLRFGTSWVPLPPVEARLTATLVDRFGAVVSRDALASAGWPDGAAGRNALDVHVLRLRRRVGPLGLSIKTVRSRGYLMEALEPLHAGYGTTGSHNPQKVAGG
ncbi:MAG TPA: helix-turn-helix domain-containing protein [Acidimicrobiales bacterium]|nr:helix-turn-helix domain-containing protein [Acidimicrobiales bacterium]